MSLTLMLVMLGLCSRAQNNNCPPNIDFSYGNFSNWECRIGQVFSIGGVNTLMLSPSSPISNHHTLIPPGNPEVDPYGQFPKSCPYTGGYSVKLGNSGGNHEAEGLSYTYSIPSTTANFSLLFYYAVVLEDPGHLMPEQPRFRARVIDVNSFAELSCVSFDFISGSLPGFLDVGGVMVKDWTPISVDLGAYAGKTVRLEFITSDCTYEEHFGYAYVSVAAFCNGNIAGGYICDGNEQVNITAPLGYQSYAWYANQGFSQVIASGAALSIPTSNTSVGAVYPVIATPFPGFGCLDTFYAEIGTAPKPPANAGPDRTFCNNATIQLGMAGSPGYSYSWTPSTRLSDVTASNPFITPRITQQVDYILKTTDLVTRCISYDTVRVRPLVVDTASQAIGDTVYCPGEQLQTSISLSNASAQVQWFSGGMPVDGVTSPVFQPQSAGTYWALLKQFGCTDSTRQYSIYYAPYPDAAFSIDKEVQCLDQPVNFINNTTVAGNTSASYAWKFSDGQVSGDENVTRSFSSTGRYRVQLLATTGTNCMDSVEKEIMIVERCTPLVPNAFTPDGDGLNDLLKPFAPGGRKFKRFAIYNRWGQLVFSTNREGEGWNGKRGGLDQPTGVYVWVLEYLGPGNRSEVEKGTVTLIR